LKESRAIPQKKKKKKKKKEKKKNWKVISFIEPDLYYIASYIELQS